MFKSSTNFCFRVSSISNENNMKVKIIKCEVGQSVIFDIDLFQSNIKLMWIKLFEYLRLSDVKFTPHPFGLRFPNLHFQISTCTAHNTKPFHSYTSIVRSSKSNKIWKRTKNSLSRLFQFMFIISIRIYFVI